eukprot:4176472-Pyramimonas_sp.AAC.1
MLASSTDGCRSMARPRACMPGVGAMLMSGVACSSPPRLWRQWHVLTPQAAFAQKRAAASSSSNSDTTC